MNWTNIISGSRTGVGKIPDGVRTEYQRDFDRLIFSSAFRRLQNKTQVFPLPGSTFVHNRLTHSMEVASVGRSLGKIAGTRLAEQEKLDTHNSEFYRFELQNVIASACLAHDIGNPAFGHSGEKAISNYFIENSSTPVENTALKDFFSPEQWNDLVAFEGNANAFRILTHQFNGRVTGGYRLTYTTLASMLKYPCQSVAVEKKAGKHRSKYGFFDADKQTAADICEELNMIQESSSPLIYKRHPFVYLTEAADDICYRIIDFEDAQRLGILGADFVEEQFLGLIQGVGRPEDKIESIRKTLTLVADPNERIAYLRSKCINTLIHEASDIFMRNGGDIISGTYNDALLDELEKSCPELVGIREISQDKIYNHDTVIQIEIAGYNVMSDLLSLFIPAVLKKNKGHKDKKVLQLIPAQFTTTLDSPYYQVLSVLDYISGMTDSFATELYRKVFGIDTPKHQ